MSAEIFNHDKSKESRPEAKPKYGNTVSIESNKEPSLREQLAEYLKDETAGSIKIQALSDLATEYLIDALLGNALTKNTLAGRISNSKIRILENRKAFLEETVRTRRYGNEGNEYNMEWAESMGSNLFDKYYEQVSINADEHATISDMMISASNTLLIDL